MARANIGDITVISFTYTHIIHIKYIYGKNGSRQERRGKTSGKVEKWKIAFEAPLHFLQPSSCGQFPRKTKKINKSIFMAAAQLDILLPCRLGYISDAFRNISFLLTLSTWAQDRYDANASSCPFSIIMRRNVDQSARPKKFFLLAAPPEKFIGFVSNQS